MRAVGVALVGYGAWGRHHARAIASVPGAELRAICARSPETAADARKDYPNATVYDDYLTLLQDADVELCDVVLPSDLHYDVSRAVLESGRHLLLEKPMTLDIARGRELIELARARGRVLAVGHELRLSSLWGKVKDLDRQRGDRRTTVRADRTVAPSVPAGPWRLAIRYSTRRKLDSRGTDSLLRSRSMVFQPRRRAGVHLRTRQWHARGSPRAPR